MSSSSDAPAMPYDVKVLPYGIGRTGLAKIYRDSRGGGDYLTPDEKQVHEYVVHLEAENARLRAELEEQGAAAAEAGRAEAETDAPPPAKPKKGKP